jgi:hypothetical protein
LRCLILSLLDGFDDVLVEPFLTYRPTVALDIGVLLGLPGLDVLDGDALLLSPYSERLADVFGAFVDPYLAGLSASFDDPVQAADDPFSGQREIHLNAQAFPIEVIQNVQQPERMLITQPIRHEPKVREAKSID